MRLRLSLSARARACVEQPWEQGAKTKCPKAVLGKTGLSLSYEQGR